MNNAINLALFAFVVPALMIFVRFPRESRWFTPVRYVVAALSTFLSVAFAVGDAMGSPVAVPFYLFLASCWVFAFGAVRAFFIWLEAPSDPNA